MEVLVQTKHVFNVQIYVNIKFKDPVNSDLMYKPLLHNATYRARFPS